MYRDNSLKKHMERAELLKDTNLPIHNKIVPTKSEKSSYFKNRFVNKLVAEHMNPKENKIPSVIFDFRYVKNLNDPMLCRSMVKQYCELITLNLSSLDSFKIKFYNYLKDSMFHKNFKDVDQTYNVNFVDTYEHNYLEDFNKSDLIYLSGDAKQEIKYFDPTKTYIIGSIIDKNDEHKYSSFTTAKKEGITSLRLPIDKYIR